MDFFQKLAKQFEVDEKVIKLAYVEHKLEETGKELSGKEKGLLIVKDTSDMKRDLNNMVNTDKVSNGLYGQQLAQRAGEKKVTPHYFS